MHRLPIAKRGCLATLAIAALACNGCDPVVDIAGADFPAWLICAIAGVALAAAVRMLFDAVGVEPYLGPLTLIYPSLAVLLGCAVWLVFFNRI